MEKRRNLKASLLPLVFGSTFFTLVFNILLTNIDQLIEHEHYQQIKR